MYKILFRIPSNKSIWRTFLCYTPILDRELWWPNNTLDVIISWDNFRWNKSQMFPKPIKTFRINKNDCSDTEFISIFWYQNGKNDLFLASELNFINMNSSDALVHWKSSWRRPVVTMLAFGNAGMIRWKYILSEKSSQFRNRCDLMKIVDIKHVTLVQTSFN